MMRSLVKPALYIALPMARGPPGSSQAIDEEVRSEAGAPVEGVGDEDGNIAASGMGAETAFEVVVFSGARVAIRLRTTRQFHVGGPLWKSRLRLDAER